MCIAGMEIEEIKLTQKTIVKIKKIKFINRIGSLDSLAKTQGMFVDPNDPKDKKTTWVVRTPKEKTIAEWNDAHPPQVQQLATVPVGNGEDTPKETTSAE
jgi:hypothetical protein